MCCRREAPRWGDPCHAPTRETGMVEHPPGELPGRAGALHACAGSSFDRTSPKRQRAAARGSLPKLPRVSRWHMGLRRPSLEGCRNCRPISLALPAACYYRWQHSNHGLAFINFALFPPRSLSISSPLWKMPVEKLCRHCRLFRRRPVGRAARSPFPSSLGSRNEPRWPHLGVLHLVAAWDGGRSSYGCCSARHRQWPRGRR